MLPNEVFALECIARYAKEGLVRDSTWEFAHCPYPKPRGQKNRLTGDKGYWLTFNDHQHQGLLQSVDVGRKCYYTYKVKLWLDTKPPGYEELIVIYNKFNKHTEESKKNISESNSGKIRTEEQNKATSERVSGENHPQFGVPLTEETKKKLSEAMSGRYIGALSPLSKAIIAIKPDGTELHFGSIREAARELGILSGSLCYFLNNGKQPKKGKCEGCQFFYEVKE